MPPGEGHLKKALSGEGSLLAKGPADEGSVLTKGDKEGRVLGEHSPLGRPEECLAPVGHSIWVTGITDLLLWNFICLISQH